MAQRPIQDLNILSQDRLKQIMAMLIQGLKILNQRLKVGSRLADLLNQSVKILIRAVKRLNQEPEKLIQPQIGLVEIIHINQWGYRIV